MPPFDTSVPLLLLWGLIGYLLGSIPSGMILSRLMGLGNLRDIGSGNIGATNVLRTGNKVAAALTVVFDAGKGIAAVLLARHFAGETAAQLAALTAMLGHCFPVWLGFRGGKAVATFLGVLIALSLPMGLAACLVWLAAAIITRISSMGALACAAAAPILAVLFNTPATLLCVALAALIFWRHSANIARIRAGTEPRIGSKG